MTEAFRYVADAAVQPWRHRYIIRALASRELSARYRGSLFGGLWAILQPLAVVALFYYVLVVVFKARWSSESASDGDFIVGMFIGLLLYNVLAETVGRSTGVIVSNVNYVKRIVFPITILPIVQLAFALSNLVLGGLALLVFGIYWGNLTLSSSWLALPLVLLPISFWSLGLGWFTAAFNVYFRDTSVVVPLVLQGMLFLSPIFYSSENLPANIRGILAWSPLAMAISETRRVMMHGQEMDLTALLIPSLMGLIVLVLGYLFFRRVKPGFADVL